MTTAESEPINNVDHPSDVMISSAQVRPLLERADAEIAALRAEVTRLRARVQVEAEDVERAGVTRAQVEAWLGANGWRKAERNYPDGTTHWVRGDGGYSVLACPDAHVMALTVQAAADVSERRGLDILDEMAAMPLEPLT
jgi:hypothetical protein